MAASKVWIVEMLNTRFKRPRWEPTVGAALTRVDAVRKRREWKQNCPHDHFRVACYYTTRSPR